MARIVDIDGAIKLDNYAAVADLAPAVAQLRIEAAQMAAKLRGRIVWMVNSTPQGGGVAELLPPLISILRDLGIATEWVVIESEEEEFFRLTKRIHNMIHGSPDGELGPAECELFERVSDANARSMEQFVAPGDILVIHDPQPIGAGAILCRTVGLRAIWRCHIGLDERTEPTLDAWRFLEPYASEYGATVFSAPEYIPDFLAGRATVIPPAIDPLSHKNRDLPINKLVGILCDSGLSHAYWPLVAPPFEQQAKRLQSDGRFGPATQPEDLGVIARPIITQVSRWDRLKGFAPLMRAFTHLRRNWRRIPTRDQRHHRRLEIARLVLAGPDPASIPDDPEALEVLDELREQYVNLDPEIQRDIAIVALPMDSKKNNALTVNALQRAATIVVQNSLREGFGLTVTEAMWKSKPVLGNSRACGLRHQIRDGVDGRMIADPEDTEGIAQLMHEMLGDSDQLDAWGSQARRHVHDEFLVFAQVRRWLHLLSES